jgi:glycosyltransferase involved in cell wall biosynthesis
MLGTERFAFFRDIPTHTDLAPFHPWLFWHLRGFQILHTTDTFYAFAKTARWRARLSGIPLITSVQTDLIGWTRIYAPTFLRRLLHSRVLVRWLLETQHYLDREERFMENRFRNYLQTCQAVLVSHERDWKRVQRLVPDLPLFFLRRGIDLEAFHPRLRARQQVEQRFGIPPGRVLLLFVGRLDPVKGALIAAEVVHRLAHQGKNVYLLVVGEGAQRQEIAQVLGDRGTCTGNLPHAELGSIYASADLLLFPSESEVWPNVVIEARACGLPVIACTQGAGHIMKGEGWDGILVPDRHPETWLSVVEALLDRPTTLQEMGRRARQAIEESVPTWSQVLEEDLLPVWRAVARDTSAELRQVWPKLGKISLRRLLHR